MKTPENQNEELSKFQKFMQSHTARLFIIGFITLVLLIPLSNIGWLIHERQQRQVSVTDELKNEWGDELDYYGVALEIPLVDSKTKKQTPLFIYPEESNDQINSSVTERYRGIFKANLFTAETNSTNIFDLSKVVNNPDYRNANWNRARFVLITGNNVKFKELNGFSINGTEIGISDQTKEELLYSRSNRFVINPQSQQEIKVTTKSIINGSCALKFHPLAAKAKMSLISNWKSPSFSGSLPNSNSFHLTKTGFTASWSNMSQFGSGSRSSVSEISIPDLAASEITFMTMVDQYQLNERTIKYGFLVLVLTFAVFFLIQLIGKVNVHPFHYFMIGLALSLFYSLLLAFSEHLGFNGAYCLASGAIILLIVWYARAILNSLKFAIVSGISLTLLYGFLLVIVNLEVFAMLVGSLGLLIVLAAIMSITRKLNFNKL